MLRVGPSPADERGGQGRPTELPATIRAFLAAHSARESDAALRTFSQDAVVVDQDTTYRGTARVLEFLVRAGSEFAYTSELVAAQRIDDDHWVVTNRLEGDFPGHIAVLAYRFTLTGDLISGLSIG